MRRQLRSVLVPVRRHAIPQLILDAALVFGAYYLAYRLRFGFFSDPLPDHYRRLFWASVGPVVALCLVAFVLFRVYLRSARFASVRDLIAIINGSIVGTIAT
jgi:FlaA1/EpsC-like NDP-sugar epimerase